jgi:hypothetical protein
MGASAVIDDATSEVERGVVAVDSEETMKSSAYPAEGDTFTCAQEPLLGWDPLGGEGGQGFSKPAGRVGEARATQSGSLLSSRRRVGALLIETVLPITVGPVLVEGVADDGAEVARERTEVISVQLEPELGLGLLEHVEWIAAIGGDELRDREIEVIDLVQVSEQEALAVLIGARSIASASRRAHQRFLIETRTLLDSRASRTSARLIGAKEARNEQMSKALGELDIAQLRDGLRDPVRQSEQRSSNGLESAEASFHRTLAEWVAFTLRSMFGAECDESVAGQLGHVWRSLIADSLQPFTTGDGRGPYGDDVLGAFVIIDDNRVKEILIATTDVLGSDEFERHTENRQVGGVCAELSVGDDEVEAKAWTSLSAATSPARLGGGGQHGVVAGTGLRSWRSGREPGPQRAPGQGQRFAEPVLSEARCLGTEAKPGSDEQGPQRWAAQVDLCEHGGGYGEQGSEQRYLVVLGRLSSRATAASA